jgi:hypothetical protein
MDMRTGRTYETLDAALAAGVPRSDVAEIVDADVVRRDDAIPVVRFASGPFKGRAYKRDGRGNLVRVPA